MGKVLGLEALSGIKEWVNSKDTALKAELQAQIGSPLVASTVAGMTDHTKVYVYTGSETGYTAGNWYYYNGSAWTSGGVYNSTAFETDPTLTIEGMAADAKATGDEITHVKQDTTTLAPPFNVGNSDLVDNGYLSPTTGVVTTDVSGFAHSKLYKIPEGASKVNLRQSGTLAGGAVVAFYTGYLFSATTFISGVTVPDSTVLPISISIPSNAHYVAFCNRTSANFEAYIAKNETIEFANNLKCGVNLGLQPGTISATGTISYSPTAISNYLSDILFKDTFQSIRITPKEGFLCNVAYFNNGTFISRGSSWTSAGATLEINNTYDCIIMLASETSVSKTAEEMLAEYNIEIITAKEIQQVYNQVADIESRSLFMEKIESAIACGKVIHFSIDDCYRALRRLYTESYTSIFDNYIFALLKDVHDTTGAKFTMNVINEVSSSVDGEGFDIANVPNTFASEFQANKSWLKFSWHGLWNSLSYSEFSTSYAKFVSNVYRFTGTYDCIDRMIRTEGFSGNAFCIQALKDNANAPLIGLLTADDSRTSYYLNTAQNSIAISKGKYIDYNNKLVFIRSATRLDNVSASQLIAEIEGNPCYQNFVEVWYHEGLTGEPMRTTLKSIGNWASENGYNNYYPSKIFE